MTQAAIVTNSRIGYLYGAGNDKASLAGSYTAAYISTLWDVPDDVGIGYTWDGVSWSEAPATPLTIDSETYAEIIQEAVESTNELVSKAVTAESTSRVAADANLQSQIDSLLKSLPIQAETGTSYDIVDGDRGDLITFENGSAVAVTLPQAGGSIINGWYVWLSNTGVGDVTVTPSVSTINGASDITIATDETLLVVSDGSDYFAALVSAGGVSSVAGRTGVVTFQASDRNASGLNIDDTTTVGDADATIAATDRVVITSATFTNPRTWTLPAANALNAGQVLIVADAQGTVTTTNTITLARAGSDTINGATSAVIKIPYGLAILWSDGTSKWICHLPHVNSTSAVLTASTIELGAASDTTLSRSSAGNVAIEGNVIYRAGGTDVSLADGGTGASLSDPGADSLMFWDDSAGSTAFLSVGAGLSISGTELTATSAGGGWTFIDSTGIDTTVASVTFTGTWDYDEIQVRITKLSPSTSPVSLRVALSDDGGSTTIDCGARYMYYTVDSGPFATIETTTQEYIYAILMAIDGGATVGTAAADDHQAVITIMNCNSASGLKPFTASGSSPDANSLSFGMGALAASAAINYIKVYYSTGNIDTTGGGGLIEIWGR